jgi:hypothetical protein
LLAVACLPYIVSHSDLLQTNFCGGSSSPSEFSGGSVICGYLCVHVRNHMSGLLLFLHVSVRLHSLEIFCSIWWVGAPLALHSRYRRLLWDSEWGVIADSWTKFCNVPSGSTKMQGIYWLLDELLASQEGFCSLSCCCSLVGVRQCLWTAATSGPKPPGCPVRNHTLYRLSYSGSLIMGSSTNSLREAPLKLHRLETVTNETKIFTFSVVIYFSSNLRNYSMRALNRFVCSLEQGTGRQSVTVTVSYLYWTQNNCELRKRHSKRGKKMERARGERHCQQSVRACIV